MSYKFKVGDEIRIHRKLNSWSSAFGAFCPMDFSYPRTFIIEKIKNDVDGFQKSYIFMKTKDGYGFALSDLIKNENIELINNLTNKTMNIKEKFVLALTSEPKKSFRKAGITDGDNLLTDEGTKVFLTWLLHTHYANEFKKEVVDDMLKEKENK